jgi:hypothetical protein
MRRRDLRLRQLEAAEPALLRYGDKLGLDPAVVLDISCRICRRLDLLCLGPDFVAPESC